MKFLISPNFIRDNTKNILNKVTGYLDEKAEYRLDDYTSGPDFLNGFVPDIVLFIGGDGTFLKSAQRALYFDVPLIGIKNGGIAYLCDIDESTTEACLEKLLQSNYKLNECPCIDVQVNGNKYIAVNEVIVGNISVLSYFHLSSEDVGIYNTRASGVIISTGLGSTGINKSAGGFEIPPTGNSFEITPVCVYSGEKTSKLLPSSNEYELTVSKTTDVSVDGEIVETISPGNIITIRSSRKLKVIKL